jgi:hypothetical protein
MIKKKHMKKCSMSLVIKKKQIKTMVRFYLTPIRMATIKPLSRTQTTTNVGKNVGRKEASYTVGRNINKLVQPLCKTV